MLDLRLPNLSKFGIARPPARKSAGSRFLDRSETAAQIAVGLRTVDLCALDAYVDDCLEESDCFLGDSRQEGLDRISDFLAEVDRQPI